MSEKNCRGYTSLPSGAVLAIGELDFDRRTSTIYIRRHIIHLLISDQLTLLGKYPINQNVGEPAVISCFVNGQTRMLDVRKITHQYPRDCEDQWMSSVMCETLDLIGFHYTRHANLTCMPDQHTVHLDCI